MLLKDYFYHQRFAESTIASNLKYIRRFLDWCDLCLIDPKTLTYKEVLMYLKELQCKSSSVCMLNNHINSIKHYVNYTLYMGYRTDHPIEGLRVKGEYAKVKPAFLSSDELDELYYSFDAFKKCCKYKTLIRSRNKLIIGLLVYQGLSVTSLKALKVDCIEINKGRVVVPKTLRSSSRVLEFKPSQMVDVFNYLNHTREKLAGYSNRYSDSLLVPNNQLVNIVSVLSRFFKEVNYRVENTYHVRGSVIANWLKMYPIKKVQYLAGHRLISSTERYKTDAIEGLQKAVDFYHPLG